MCSVGVTCKTAKATISQPGIFLHFLKLLHVQTKLDKRIINKRQKDIITQRTSVSKKPRHIIIHHQQHTTQPFTNLVHQ